MIRKGIVCRLKKKKKRKKKKKKEKKTQLICFHIV